MRMDVSQKPFYARIYRKPRPKIGRACAIETHIGQVTKAPQDRAAQFVQACAVEMHMDMSQKTFYARIYRKNAGSQIEHPDQAPTLTLTVRTL